MAEAEQLAGYFARMDPETKVVFELLNGRHAELSTDHFRMTQEGIVIPSMERLTERPTISKLLAAAAKCLKAVQAWDGATGIWSSLERQVNASQQASQAFEDLNLGLPYGQLRLPLPDERDVVAPAHICWLCITGLDELQNEMRNAINSTMWDKSSYRFAAHTAYQCIEMAAAARHHIGRGNCRDNAAILMVEMEIHTREQESAAGGPGGSEEE